MRFIIAANGKAYTPGEYARGKAFNGVTWEIVPQVNPQNVESEQVMEVYDLREQMRRLKDVG